MSLKGMPSEHAYVQLYCLGCSHCSSNEWTVTGHRPFQELPPWNGPAWAFFGKANLKHVFPIISRMLAKWNKVEIKLANARTAHWTHRSPPMASIDEFPSSPRSGTPAFGRCRNLDRHNLRRGGVGGLPKSNMYREWYFIPDESNMYVQELFSPYSHLDFFTGVVFPL